MHAIFSSATVWSGNQNLAHGGARVKKKKKERAPKTNRFWMNYQQSIFNADHAEWEGIELNVAVRTCFKPLLCEMFKVILIMVVT